MSKQSKSQWDFGELFPAEATRRVLSVSELTAQVKRLLEKQVGSVWVTGEITNFRAQSSGHIYFTLKDAGSQLNCVLFSRESVTHRDLLADGQKVLLQGDVTVYEARGQYQLIVRAVELQGVGALQVQFEKLKAKLAAEGLFDAGRKRPLPRYPQRIGLVTSPTGAAIRDVLHVIQRRNPSLEIFLVPCRVQGEGAAVEIAEAVRLLNEFNIQHPTSNIQLILVTRGGGSLEDLWAFNEEVVARAIHESALPVVSAVGHEIDFTISDFVADVRAATPSAAAEIITEDVFTVRDFVADSPSLMSLRVRRHIERAGEDFEPMAHRLSLAHPRRRVDECLQRLDDLHANMSRCVKQTAKEHRANWRGLAGRLMQLRPSRRLKEQDKHLSHMQQMLGNALKTRMFEGEHLLKNLNSRLQLLGPEQVLARGYSITMDAATGTVLRNAGEVKAGQRLRTRLKQGEVSSRAEI
ncbi:MAG TPA: exodeoxyribonuclease VII large subunit [Verrucomicrobiota bacterium]|nr:exodeoxyribonuclease VII large subunit [Verrucomicrobiota bacterium]